MSSADKLIAAAGALLVAAAASALELVDPMQPPAAPPAPVAVEDSAVKPGAWRLGAIKIEPGRRSAMINGRIVAEGEDIDGARVVAIAPREVEIAVGNETVSLSLLQHDIKHRPSRAR
ncbi:MAG: hypothetical protein AB7I32_11800 [Gammaproteobacteria bacterium]